MSEPDADVRRPRGDVMKIRITLALDIDPEAWETNYGIDRTDSKALREDVTLYVENLVHEQLREVGVLKEGAPK